MINISYNPTSYNNIKKESEASPLSLEYSFYQPLLSSEDNEMFLADVTSEYINEYFLHHLWAEQLFSEIGLLVTTDGKSVRVKYSGLRNELSGPDFKQAQIYLNDNFFEGDIEIHLYSLDWYRHGHHLDPAYNNVILHIAGWQDNQEKTICRQDGKEIPQIILAPFLEAQFEEIERFLEIAGEFKSSKTYLHFGGQGWCSQWSLNPSYQEKLTNFLELAGEVRIFSKAKQLSKKSSFGDSSSIQPIDYKEILYQGIMEALGYKTNQENFRKLAQQVPFSSLSKALWQIAFDQKPITIQSILLHKANLIPNELEDFDEETKFYLKKLKDIYALLKPSFSLDKDLPLSWSLKNTRPANYPHRRIAGASYFFTRLIDVDINNLLKTQDLTHLLIDYFTPDPTDYWLRRTTFKGKKLTKPIALVGLERINIIEINVIIPLLMLYLRDEPEMQKKLLAQYKENSPSTDNYITRFMKYRLFGDKKDVARKIVRSPLHQQGLIQIYKDFCAHGPEACNICGLIRFLKSNYSRGGI